VARHYTGALESAAPDAAAADRLALRGGGALPSYLAMRQSKTQNPLDSEPGVRTRNP